MTISNLSKQGSFSWLSFCTLFFCGLKFESDKLNVSHAHEGGHWTCSKCNCILFVELCFNIYLVIHNFCIVFCSPQAPVFISFFIALRKMAYLPVPSFQTGGLFWFHDLTAADPFYLLPIAVTGTMFFILEVSHLLPNQSELLLLEKYHHPGLSLGRHSLVMHGVIIYGWTCTFHSNHHMSSLVVGRRVRYRQPQPARHEDSVQDHAFHHPPPHHQLPHGQSVDH